MQEEANPGTDTVEKATKMLVAEIRKLNNELGIPHGLEEVGVQKGYFEKMAMGVTLLGLFSGSSTYFIDLYVDNVPFVFDS